MTGNQTESLIARQLPVTPFLRTWIGESGGLI